MRVKDEGDPCPDEIVLASCRLGFDDAELVREEDGSLGWSIG